MNNWIDCRDCGEEFDADSPEHASKGYRNQCIDCAEEAGLDNDVVKGAIEYNADGDIMAVHLVDKDTFDKMQAVDSATKGILSGR